MNNDDSNTDGVNHNLILIFISLTTSDFFFKYYVLNLNMTENDQEGSEFPIH